jgi:hypothetical protein
MLPGLEDQFQCDYTIFLKQLGSWKKFLYKRLRRKVYRKWNNVKIKGKRDNKDTLPWKHVASVKRNEERGLKIFLTKEKTG